MPNIFEQLKHSKAPELEIREMVRDVASDKPGEVLEKLELAKALYEMTELSMGDLHALALGGEASRHIIEAVSGSNFPQLLSVVLNTSAVGMWQDVVANVLALVHERPADGDTEELPMVSCGDTEMDKVKPGEDAHEVDFFEEYVLLDYRDERRERLGIGWDLIARDKGGVVQDMISKFTARGARTLTNVIVDAFKGTDTKYYKPAGTATAVIGAGNKTTTAITLADYTDIDEAGKYVLANQTYPWGDVFKAFEMKQLIVPRALEMTAKRIVNATEIGKNTDNMRGANIDIIKNLDVIAIPDLDADSVSNWYVGNSAKQLRLRWFRKFKLTPEGADIGRMVMQKYVIDMKFGIGYLDHRYILRLT